MSDHTPGPWRFVRGAFNAKEKDESQAIGSIEGGDYWLAEVWSDYEAETPADELDGAPPMGTAFANASLMAAAPDLLAALKAVVTADAGGAFRNLTGENAQAALKAIAKAEGR